MSGGSIELYHVFGKVRLISFTHASLEILKPYDWESLVQEIEGFGKLVWVSIAKFLDEQYVLHLSLIHAMNSQVQIQG